MFLAHITDFAQQNLKDHCQNSAEIAKKDLLDIGLGNIAYSAALLHDCGKASDDFQQYLIDSFNGLNVKRGSIIHSFAGVQFFINNYHSTDDNFQKMASEIIAYSIGSHHGLFDVFTPDKQDGFAHRLTKQPEYDSKSIANFFDNVIDKGIACETFGLSVKETENSVKKIAEISKGHSDYSFYLGLLCRLITSAVMDGDRTDTANFTLGKEYNTSKNLLDSWTIINKNIENRIHSFSLKTTIDKSRREMSDICLAFAQNDSGIYRLNIPTGGGKTLSALRFAAAHAHQTGKNRVFYIAPLISILEQNAHEISKSVGEEYVLEHHSDVITDTDNAEELDLRKYLENSWNSPVIATTFAQFLNTLFSSKTSSVRRFQSLCNSVIIIVIPPVSLHINSVTHIYPLISVNIVYGFKPYSLAEIVSIFRKSSFVINPIFNIFSKIDVISLNDETELYNSFFTCLSLSFSHRQNMQQSNIYLLICRNKNLCRKISICGHTIFLFFRDEFSTSPFCICPSRIYVSFYAVYD